MDNSEQPKRIPRQSRTRFNFNYPSPEPRPLNIESARNNEREHRRTTRFQNRQAHIIIDKNGDLIFNVAQLLRSHEGATRSYDVQTAKLNLDDNDATVATNIKGHVHLTKVVNDALVQGKFEADSILNCVRCLNDFATHIEFELEDIYRPSIDVITGLPIQPQEGFDDEKLVIDENHLLDLGEALRQQILVSLPLYPHCGEDCPGLYSELERVNNEEVEVEEDTAAPVDVRWSALKNLRLEE
ncbi:MAG: DUF177 domain-containing protein [Chloroflexi bacterium]|uniref:DUF177 domain-containing protein n=1 Tax=Candidatus Chlorohelix allophototropha TaxID=3003348 RepID=A0A8T7M1G5_9CHLR|nr:DUF177 domain-containing protein [Chloroflexota bacterium]WJW67364.1 YceD family protein [Chloroflexota bacterium L227-S17]